MSAFDRLCWFAERFPDLVGPSLPAMLRECALFDFPFVPHEVLPKSHTKEELDFQREFFVLPFRCVAVQDRVGVVLLWDTEKDQKGLATRRFFVELASLNASSSVSWRDKAEDAAMRAQLPPDVLAKLDRSYNFSFGAIEVLDTEQDPLGPQKFFINGDLFAFHMLDESGPQPDGPLMLRTDPQAVTASCMRNAMTAVEELMLFNRPDRFILETTPGKERPSNAIKVARMHERKVYTLLKPQEARAKLGIPEPAGRHGAFVGERRRHVRRYPDDPARWPNMHGKSIVIPATWVGPHEARVGNKHYRIMLDL